MSQFIQFHILTSYAPANLNRDDLGAPKTAIMGGKRRLRVSSQCLKRSWRQSEVFQAQLAGALGVRTKRMGTELLEKLKARGVQETQANEWASLIAEQFGKLKKADPKAEDAKTSDAKTSDAKTSDTKTKAPRIAVENTTMIHFSPGELKALDALVEKLASTRKAPDAHDLKLLTQNRTAADIALFGRMLADKPEFNADAAAQVAHAITVHEAAVESDYFSAVDDLNRGEEDRGSGHIGEQEFGAGVFYLYVCVNRTQLLKNLGGDRALADSALSALLEACLTVSPSGKQASFGSRAYASYLMLERGERQPRSLSVAYLNPVEGRKNGVLVDAVVALRTTRAQMNTCYGPLSEQEYELNTLEAKGSLEAALAFLKEG